MGDPDYPPLLAVIPDPPAVLYYRGSLSAAGADISPPGGDSSLANGLAIVGARRPTPYGARMARVLAAGAARAGLTVVSGLARGIDTEAHHAALSAGGRTWAVLGSGIDRIYPPENLGLARAIAGSGGCVLSEHPGVTPPLAAHFPSRNRIISGLCWATVVIEGRAHSGSLITAKLAGAQGRDVLAVPGLADSELSEAPHLLIRQGARLVRTIEEILDEMPPGCLALGTYKKEAPRPEPLPPPPQRIDCVPIGKDASFAEKKRYIFDIINPLGSRLEELSTRTGLDLPQVSHILFDLELEGLVDCLDGQCYARSR